MTRIEKNYIISTLFHSSLFTWTPEGKKWYCLCIDYFLSISHENLTLFFVKIDNCYFLYSYVNLNNCYFPSGKLVNVVIPRPGPNGEPAPGVGKVSKYKAWLWYHHGVHITCFHLYYLFSFCVINKLLAKFYGHSKCIVVPCTPVFRSSLQSYQVTCLIELSYI